jgi:hypothetical protein
MKFRALMMEAVRTSETSVNFNVTTRRYIPEDSKLQHVHAFSPPPSHHHPFLLLLSGTAKAALLEISLTVL